MNLDAIYYSIGISAVILWFGVPICIIYCRKKGYCCTTWKVRVFGFDIDNIGGRAGGGGIGGGGGGDSGGGGGDGGGGGGGDGGGGGEGGGGGGDGGGA